MIDFLLPSLGADMDRAMLVAWLVEPGDPVKYGQVIAEVETDKGVIEIECWHDGVVAELLLEPGPERLDVGTVLARIRDEAEVPAVAPPEPEKFTPPPAELSPARHEPPPPIRHLAHTLGVDLADVVGSGPGGSVTREDVRQAAAVTRPPPAAAATPAAAAVTTPAAARPSRGVRPKASPLARRRAAESAVDLTGVAATRFDGLITRQDVEVAGSVPGARENQEDKALAMRSAIARSMSRSKREIPHYYLGTTIDLDRALRWLEHENESRSISERILPAVMLLKATALAIREVPELNGHWVDDRFHPAEAVHLGVAVSLREGGLVAPAIHHADQLDLGDLMERLRDLVTRARSWRLRGSEMSDPTVTVTNLGDRGVEMAFPVIIPPQVAMVGFGRIVEAVVVVDGSPVVHPVVQATLAGDHRATDGHRGGLFLSALDRLLQEPGSL
jgi:pyruvate dehydrogenase E2 component (dihydrolipoamide acetyltransferase)